MAPPRTSNAFPLPSKRPLQCSSQEGVKAGVQTNRSRSVSWACTTSRSLQSPQHSQLRVTTQLPVSLPTLSTRRRSRGSICSTNQLTWVKSTTFRIKLRTWILDITTFIKLILGSTEEPMELGQVKTKGGSNKLWWWNLLRSNNKIQEGTRGRRVTLISTLPNIPRVKLPKQGEPRLRLPLSLMANPTQAAEPIPIATS
jgi:hypothetical protein